MVEASEKLRGYGVRTEIWSVTSYGELRREGIEVERMKRLNPSDDTEPYVVSCFGDDVPTVAASDYIAAVPEMIQRWVGGRFVFLEQMDMVEAIRGPRSENFSKLMQIA